jgi:uncharacterized hydrophobic protein (TIGR00341 family)
MFKYLARRLHNHKEEQELKDAINHLVEDSAISTKYIILTVSSAMIAALGLIMENMAIVIGSMLIAPLLLPVVGLSIGVGAGSVKLVWHSIKSLVVGLVLAIAGSSLIGYFFLTHITWGMFSNFTDSYLYSIVAFIAGIVAVYSWLKPEKYQIIPGVTIAVALIPPVAFMGLVLVDQDSTVLVDTLQLIIVNLVGLFIGGLITFMLFAFLSKRPTEDVDQQVEDEVEKKTK